MAITHKNSAVARVLLDDGTYVNYFDSLQSADDYANDANRRAEEMGIEARYTAYDMGDFNR